MTIRSRPSTDTYRDGWDRVFGPKVVVRGAATDPMNRAIAQLQHSESLDSHPAAD